jgi:hypothetical protein
MPESSSLSWPECGRTSALQSVQFWPLGEQFIDCLEEVAGWEEFVRQTSTN